MSIIGAFPPPYRRLLSLAPDTPDTRAQVWLNDLSAFWGLWERVGVARPAAEDGAGAYRERFREVMSKLRDSGVSVIDFPMPMADPWIAGFGDQSYTETVDFFPYAGVDARNADSMLRTGQAWSLGFSRVQETLEVSLGTYTAAAILEAIAVCAECVPAEVSDHQGVSYMSWSDDFQQSRANRLKGPFFDSFGRGGRVAAFDGALYRALSTEGMEQLIDARLGRLPNLAQDRDYQLAAAGLAALDVYAALVSSTDFSFGGLEDNMATICITPDKAYSGSSRPVSQEQTSTCTTSGRPGSVGWAVARTSPLMRPFKTAAFGTVWDSVRTATDNVIVIVHADENAARENVGLLVRRLAETHIPDGLPMYADEIERVEIGTVGRMLIAKIIRKAGAFPIEYLQPYLVTRIPPAIHE